MYFVVVVLFVYDNYGFSFVCLCDHGRNGPIHRKRGIINKGIQVDETKCEVFLFLINPLVPNVSSFNAQCVSEIAI